VFVSSGLRQGESVVVDGAIRVAAGAPLKIAQVVVPPPAAWAGGEASSGQAAKEGAAPVTEDSVQPAKETRARR
jgi:membrane fusion protein, multidrug efflux system